MMTSKNILALSLLILCGISVSGQTVFRADREAYQSNNYEYDFVILSDSVSYMRGYYRDDFSKYSLYKGHMEKINDTLYGFTYQPVVEFGCNKRLHWREDSVQFNIRQTDTTILPMSMDVNVLNGNRKVVELKDTRTSVLMKGAGQHKFTLDTEFIDPLTKKKVIMTIEPHSEPDLMYYGTGTSEFKLKISIVNKVMTIYPDNKHILDKDTFLKIE